MPTLLCPVCSGKLIKNEHEYVCPAHHCFDIAKEGYVNLLNSSKNGDMTGDSKASARSRRDFLSKGYYSPLASALCGLCKEYKTGGSILDICCGEGYYSSYIAQNSDNYNISGFDISKEMVRLACKRQSTALYFVANMTGIPVGNGSFDILLHLFAPFYESEFARILKPDGVLFSVTGGKRHLFGLKKVLYDEPYFNEEIPGVYDSLELVDTKKVTSVLTLHNNADIMSLLKMTPYFYHTPAEGLRRLESLNELTTELEFVIFIYRKKKGE